MCFSFLVLSGNDSEKNDIQKKREQLRLAVEWGRVDIAERFIMKNERNWDVSYHGRYTCVSNTDDDDSLLRKSSPTSYLRML